MPVKSTRTCSKCGETKPLDEFYDRKDSKDEKRTDCKKCTIKRSREYYQTHRKERSEKGKEYRQKNLDKIRERKGHKPMYENKLCSSYLGVFIAERLCRHLFKDVEVMPYGHTGYDIICNKGKKIDVKSSCTRFLDGDHPHWVFEVDHNIIADFFICVAFDNRINLNLLYMWMIPGHEVNNQGKASISPSTVHKWDEWKRDIDDAKLCCTEMKTNVKHNLEGKSNDYKK